ncbi:hypothetical protein [Prevotellamassilia timonensis]|uniref:hypothetical protein n=1 Tax=Prevotellamassilia timonensis TaxID=1852370 RepID=UPI0023F22C51|nr:hypothetical protein [Prevotellamassilia timonensis]MDD7440984.1 hypothetical protein [Prevotellamassilia timonensis]
MNNGYVSVPREFFDSIQWRRKRIFTESEAYLDLLQMAYYGSEPTERMVGRRSFIVKRGQIITTTSFLAERWGWKLHRVRYVLRALSVTSFVTSIVTSGRTIITVNQGNTSNCSEKSVTSFVTSIVNNKNKITKKKITKKSVESSVVCDTTPHAQAEGEVAEAEVSQVAEVAAVPEAATEVVEVAAEAKAASIVPAAEAKAEPAAAPKPATRRRTPPMQRPTVWEVEKFCRTQGLQLVDAQRFVDYYEANGWKVGRNPMRSWQAAARNWQRRELQYQQPAAMAAIKQTNLFTEPNCANNHEHSYAVQPAHDGAKFQQQQSQQQLQQPQPRVFSYQSQPSLWQRQQCATKAGACAEALEQYAARQMRYFASMGAEEPDF